jgi:hypothetical protein
MSASVKLYDQRQASGGDARLAFRARPRTSVDRTPPDPVVAEILHFSSRPIAQQFARSLAPSLHTCPRCSPGPRFDRLELAGDRIAKHLWVNSSSVGHPILASVMGAVLEEVVGQT